MLQLSMGVQISLDSFAFSLISEPVVKNLLAKAGDNRFDPWVRGDPRRCLEQLSLCATTPEAAARCSL